MAQSWDDDEPRGASAFRIVLYVALPLVLAAVAVVHWSQRAPTVEPVADWADDARRELQAIVESRYVEEMTPERSERLFDEAMKGYVDGLDAFSRYYTAKERAALEEGTSGSFGGVGVRIESVSSGMLVVAIRRGGPADLAGIEPGELIEKVGDVPLTGREQGSMIELIKGPAGTTVEFSVRSAKGGALRRVQTTRAKVDLDTVPGVRTYDGAPPVGYLRLSQFSDTTASEARDAMRSLLAKAPGAIVLDLRRNLGGVVQGAVDVASLFLPAGTLVCTCRAREGTRAYRTAVKDGFAPTELPLVLLVDETSASASEILAGALQDHGRAVLVGDRTYGKFVMQTIVPLAHRGAMLSLTTARYETPLGRSDQRDQSRSLLGGLLPDVRVPLRSQAEERSLGVDFARQSGLAWKVLPGREAADAAPDRQLAAALDLLRGAAAPAEPVPARTN